MNVPAVPGRLKRTPLALAAVLCVCLVLVGPAPAAAPPVRTVGPSSACSACPVGTWLVFPRNRSQMTQVALVAMALAIFILTRGRWK